MIHEIHRERTIMRCTCGFVQDMMSGGKAMGRVQSHILKHRPNVVLIDSKRPGENLPGEENE